MEANLMEQYNGETKGESAMKEKIENLADKILEMRKEKPELLIRSTLLYDLPKEDTKGIGGKEIEEIVKIVRKKENEERKNKAVAKLKEGKRNIIPSKTMESMIKQSENFSKRHPKD